MSHTVAGAPPVRPRRRNPRIALAVGAVAVLVTAGAGVYVLMGGQAKVTLTGSMTLMPSAYMPSGTAGCTGKDGYDDIAQGTSVVVHDASGKVIATGQLGAGSIERGAFCVLPFRVPGVPEQRFYGVEVSHRGVASYTAAQAKRPLEMALGSTS